MGVSGMAPSDVFHADFKPMPYWREIVSRRVV
jgi:hypothetical protein